MLSFLCACASWNDLAEEALAAQRIPTTAVDKECRFRGSSMAKCEETVVWGAPLRDCIAAKEQFYDGFRGAGPVENLGSYP
jgi:hypothetical protein